MMRELIYMGQKTNESKKEISRIPLCFSVSQKVRFVFTCFLYLQKFLWLLLRHHLEEFLERKQDFLTSVVSLLLRVVLCTLIGTLFNSSLLLPQIDLKFWAQKEWKYLYKYFMDSSGLISIFA